MNSSLCLANAAWWVGCMVQAVTYGRSPRKLEEARLYAFVAMTWVETHGKSESTEGWILPEVQSEAQEKCRSNCG